MEQNLNKLLKEYGYALTNSANNSEEIRKLEENEIKIKERVIIFLMSCYFFVLPL